MPFGSLRIARIFEIDIEINVTWIVIFVLVVFQLTAYFPSVYQDFSGGLSLLLALITAAMFFASLLIHELSHSLVANRNDLAIKKITLFIFGGVAQMEGEPKTPLAELRMAIAGPISSILLATLFYVIGLSVELIGLPEAISAPFVYLAPINLMLALFNLIPGFPLDGGRVLRAFIWLRTGDINRATSIAAKVGEGFAYTLMASGFIVGIIFRAFEAVWFILIGWFLQNAAQSSYRHTMFESALATVRVRDLMTSDLYTIDADLSLDKVVTNHFLTHKYSRFPVAEREAIKGIITLADIKKVPRELWATMTAGEALEPMSPELLIEADEPALKAIDRMAKTPTGHFLVTENEKIIGIVTRADVVKIMQIRDELGLTR